MVNFLVGQTSRSTQGGYWSTHGDPLGRLVMGRPFLWSARSGSTRLGRHGSIGRLSDGFEQLKRNPRPKVTDLNLGRPSRVTWVSTTVKFDTFLF